MAPTSHSCDCQTVPRVHYVYGVDYGENRKSELDKLKEENSRLKRQLARAQHELFQARNRGNRR